MAGVLPALPVIDELIINQSTFFNTSRGLIDRPSPTLSLSFCKLKEQTPDRLRLCGGVCEDRRTDERTDALCAGVRTEALAGARGAVSSVCLPRVDSLARAPAVARSLFLLRLGAPKNHTESCAHQQCFLR